MASNPSRSAVSNTTQFDSSASSLRAPRLSSGPTSSSPNADDEANVESPSLSTPSARARFEFEPGRGNEGTKILMVEWEEDDATRVIPGSWKVSWEGKSHVLPAEEGHGSSRSTSATSLSSTSEATGVRQESHRLFFLLPSGVNVPATVTLTLIPQNGGEPVEWRTNPLPAIFPPGLYESTVGGQARSGKGVLHTLWAKKRLSTLSHEIEQEARTNSESVGLEMALRERLWIENTFGISSSGSSPSFPMDMNKPLLRHDAPLSPTTPLPPGGSRLTEKLKGLKLQTGEGDLKSAAPYLTPEDDDVAVSMFSSRMVGFKSPGESRRTPQTSRSGRTGASQPADPRARLHAQGSSMGSLGAVLSGSEPNSGSGKFEPEDEAGEEELFALPLSPRSPDMTKSPFSFEPSDTLKYLQGGQKVI